MPVARRSCGWVELRGGSELSHQRSLLRLLILHLHLHLRMLCLLRLLRPRVLCPRVLLALSLCHLWCGCCDRVSRPLLWLLLLTTD